MRKPAKAVIAFMTGLLAVAMSGGDAGAQVTAEEVYDLARVGETTLPATITDDDDGCTEEVVSGTLTLAPDGTWRLVVREREVCGSDTEDDVETETGRFTMDGDTITFLDEDGQPEDIDESDRNSPPDVEDLVSGTRTAEGITVMLDDGTTEMMFRRR